MAFKQKKEKNPLGQLISEIAKSRYSCNNGDSDTINGPTSLLLG
jgi:hypothetical protein